MYERVRRQSSQQKADTSAPNPFAPQSFQVQPIAEEKSDTQESTQGFKQQEDSPIWIPPLYPPGQELQKSRKSNYQITPKQQNNNTKGVIQQTPSSEDTGKQISSVSKEGKSLNLSNELQSNLKKFGLHNKKAEQFNASAYKHLISSDPSEPFTGVGATGINPMSLSMGLIDKAAILYNRIGNSINSKLDDTNMPLLKDGLPGVAEGMVPGSSLLREIISYNANNTTKRYENPLTDRRGQIMPYVFELKKEQRLQQVRLLVNQQISTLFRESYNKKILSRKQVISAAAETHKLHPELVAAFILAEQRDQSQNEDAKDFIAAIQAGYNSSIGLGQVVISTAKNNDLFADLLSKETRQSLTHNQIATLLASDEFNIFATASYMRKVANMGSKIHIDKLPNMKSAFPGIDMQAFGRHSKTWTEANIKALASEYTTEAWDNVPSTDWDMFVFEAYKDVVASKVFQ